MGRKPVYRNDTTSMQVSQLVSVILGMRRRFNETKGDVIERIILAQEDPRFVDDLREQLSKRIESEKQKKLDALFIERDHLLKQTSLLVGDTNTDSVSSDNMERINPNKIYSKKEIVEHILIMNNLPKDDKHILSVEHRRLTDYIERGIIIRIDKDHYKIASEEQISELPKQLNRSL